MKNSNFFSVIFNLNNAIKQNTVFLLFCFIHTVSNTEEQIVHLSPSQGTFTNKRKNCLIKVYF